MRSPPTNASSVSHYLVRTLPRSAFHDRSSRTSRSVTRAPTIGVARSTRLAYATAPTFGATALSCRCHPDGVAVRKK